MKGNIAVAGFMLTAEEWEALDAASRAQLVAVITRREDPSGPLASGSGPIVLDAAPASRRLAIDSGPVDSGPVDSGPLAVDSGPLAAPLAVDSGPIESGPVDFGPLAVDSGPLAAPLAVAPLVADSAAPVAFASFDSAPILELELDESAPVHVGA